MDSTVNTKQPWVEWVNGREQQLELLSSIAKIRVEEVLRLQVGISSDKDIYGCLQLCREHWVPCSSKSELWRINPLSCRQQEQVPRDARQQWPQLRRSPLLKPQLNESSQLLSHLKPGGSAAQKLTANIVTKRALRLSAFTSSPTAFCHGIPAFSETLYTLTETSHPRVREDADGSVVESGQGQLDNKLGKSVPQVQSIKLSELHGAESVRASRSDCPSEPVLALSENLQVVQTVRCPPEVLPNRSMAECDRPTITWLSAARNNAVAVRRTKIEDVTPRPLYGYSQSRKDFAFSSRNCGACDDSEISHQVYTAESLHRSVRKNLDQRWPQTDQGNRDQLRVRKREKTRSGLLCQILGETSETERQGRSSRDRRKKSEVYAMDLQRRSSKGKRQHLRTEQNPEQLVVSLEQLLMELLSEEEESGQLVLTPQTSVNVGSNKDYPRPSVQCWAEDGLVEVCQWLERQEDLTSPPHSPSKCCLVDEGTLTTLPKVPHEFLGGDTDDQHEAVDECLFEPYDVEEDDENLKRRVVELKRLADKVLDSVVMDVAVELERICTSVMDNLVFSEFGNIEQ